MCSYPPRNRKFQKNSKKIQKIKKYNNGFISSHYRYERERESEKIKIIVTFRSHQTGNRKFQKNSKKIKNTIMASFQAKIGWKMPRKRENKNYLSDRLLPDVQLKIPKKLQKN